MNASPFFSVIILTHNYGRYIRRAIESVLQQTCDSWELFICDDASTDDTAAIVESFLADPRHPLHPPRFQPRPVCNWSAPLDLGSAGHGPAPCRRLLASRRPANCIDQFSADDQIDLVYGNWMIAREGVVRLQRTARRTTAPSLAPKRFRIRSPATSGCPPRCSFGVRWSNSPANQTRICGCMWTSNIIFGLRPTLALSARSPSR